MSHGAGRLGRALVGWLAWTWCCAAVACAVDGVPANLGGELVNDSRDMLRTHQSLDTRDLGGARLHIAERLERRPGRGTVDLSPVVDGIFGFLNRHGVPLREQRDEAGRGPIGVYANFSVGRDVPALSFHLGDRPLDRIGAFYSNERGFRCALVWPVERFTLRLEGGEDSELGYYGIAGLQWLHPRRPIAIGIGLPMNLRDTERGAGVVVQFRMTLE